jgi:outer membrane receptor protein involved in Fe transport
MLAATVTDSAGMTREDRMVRISAKYLLASLALVLLTALFAVAQAPATGKLTGTVTDAQIAVIPRATILAKNDQTGAEFRTVANEVGVWVIPSIPSGSYTVTVTAQGFRIATLKEIKVDTGSSATVDATLQIGFDRTIVVTASKFEEEVVNAPATASVISEQTIRYSPTQNFGDLLRAVPGMNVTQTSAGSFGVNGRAAGGATPYAQLALIDGRTLYQDTVGWIIWSVVPTNLDGVKQMEVVRGPASAVWGAYAMNGVINIITKPPREALGTSFTFGIGTFDRSGGVAESNRGSLYYVNATHAQALNDRWAFKLTGSAYTQDAFARPKGTIPNQFNLYPSPSFKNEGTTQPKIDARVDYDLPGGKRHFTFACGYARSSGIEGGAMGGARSDMASSYGKLDYIRGALRISGYANKFTTDGTMLIRFTPTGQPLPWIDHNQAYHFEFSDFRKVLARHLFSYGGNVRHSEISLLMGVTGPKKRTEGGVYLQDEVLLSDHFRWVVGARMDKFDNVKGALFSPRTTFNVKPASGQTFRVSYNRAYVAPAVIYNYWQWDMMSWWDLGILIHPLLAGYSHPFRMDGNRNLKVPSLDAYEVGYSAVMAKDRVHLGAAFYINDTRHDIYWQLTDSYTSQNPPPGWPLPPFVLDMLIAVNAFGPGIGLPSLSVARNRSEGSKTRNKGIELNVDARLSRAIDVFSNYSWQAKPATTGFDVSEVNLPPTNRFNAGINFDYKRYLGNVSVGYVGRAYWQDITLYGGWTDAYTVINLSAGVRLDRSGKYMAMLKISNLANALVQNHIYGDIIKRQISGEFRMRF